MSFVTLADGTRLYYEIRGEGEPLLLVSGGQLDHSLWDGLRDDFTDHYRVIVYDNRGTGQSDKPSSPPYSTRGFAQDAVALLDQLGITRAYAYGTSMGGRICQWLGIDHGNRIGALVLSATSPGNAHGVARQPEVTELFAQASHLTSQEALERWLALFFSPDWIATHLQEAKDIFFKSAPIPAYASRMHYQASEEHNAWDLLPMISVPTLVMHGSDDQMNPLANAYLLAERIPGSELYIIKGGRHGYISEFREESSHVVKEFLARHHLV